MHMRVPVIGTCILLVLSAVMLLSAGCAGGSNPSPASGPPAIPPQSTFVMDFSVFTQTASPSATGQRYAGQLVSLLQDAGPTAAPPGALGDRANWGFAALNVGFWNVAVLVGLAVPVASFVQSIKQTPVRQPDGSWVWTYGITVQGTTYTAALHAKYIATGVQWDMYITKQGEYTDFLWYYGESDLSATQGFWILKDKPSAPNDLLRIDWHRNPANETGDIKYTNIVPGGAENGGYISFTMTDQEPYDRSYTIYNKGKNETTYIQWNGTTKAGSVRDSVHFGDNDWHCWDSTLKDSTCS